MNLITLAKTSSYRAALQILEWNSIVQDEFQALLQQHTCDLIPKPTNHPIIDSKWVFKTKLNVDRSLAQHKAQLVALGNN